MSDQMEKFKSSFLKAIKPFKGGFKSDDSRFILATGLKTMSISLIVSLFSGYLIWFMITYNNIFFEANGFPEIAELKQAFFDYITQDLLSSWYWFLSFYVVLFFMGVYIGKILLRPFEIIGDYCHNTIENIEEQYNPDTFSEFKLLTRFSEFFFKFVYDCRKNNKLVKNSVPPQFTKIHTPVFDKIFFFHFSLFVFILMNFSLSVILYVTGKVHENIIRLSLNALKKPTGSVTYFLNNQEELILSVQIFTIAAVIIGYFFLSFHLYGKVSGAAFGFFSTMRSFMKGNFEARVHLVGYYHIRPHSRMFNKYLDYICRNLQQENPKPEKKSKSVNLKVS